MGIGWVESCLFVFGPVFAAACGAGVCGPLSDGLFVVALLVKHRGMLDEYRLERRCVTRDLVCQNL